jgi:hypothetical protein
MIAFEHHRLGTPRLALLFHHVGVNRRLPTLPFSRFFWFDPIRAVVTRVSPS